VIDSAGKPVAGAEVAPSFWLQVPGEGHPVKSDQEGRFWLRLTRSLPEEFIIAIDRQRRLRGHTLLPQTSPSESQKTPLEIRLAPTGTITGRVMEGDKPVANAAIQADELEPVKGSQTGRLQTNDRYSAKTDQDGRFEIPLVEAEHRLHLSVYSEGYTETEGRHGTVEVTAGQTLEVQPFSVMRTDKVVSGIVVDPDGNPVAGASVSARMRSGESIPRAFTTQPTGKDGRFAIRGVPNVPLTLMAYIRPPEDSKDRTIHHPAHVEAEPGQTDVRIVLDPNLARGKK
jgi:5-hydroxyisourate hydrolase-like protein (transthyretin family)